LNGCYFGANDTDCTRIAREPMFGSITNIFDLDQNVGTTQTSGIDLSARYSLPTVGGRFGLLFDSTYLIYYRQTQPSCSVISAAGSYDLGSGAAPIGNLTPKVKFNAGLDYALAGLNAGVRARYIGGFDECAGIDGTSGSAGLCSQPSQFDPRTG